MDNEEYLTYERGCEHRNEFVLGEVRSMQKSAGKNHGKIVAGAIMIFYSVIKKSMASVMNTQMRVYAESFESFVYPDVLITCEEEKYLDDEFDTLLNPTIVIEVLSKTTEDYDRGTKFALYRSIPSLKNYMLVSSLEYSIEVYTRDGEQWILTTASHPDDFVYLSAVDYRFQLKDMYVQVPDLGK